MKSPNQFIVTPVNDRRYDNTKAIAGTDLILNTSEESASFSNREAKVISTPIYYKGPVKEGDTILVHHNVFKFYNDMYGRRQSGKSYLQENLFLVDYDQFFLYKHKDKWIGHDKYCFVKPSKIKESFIKKSGSIEPLVGTIKYINKELINLGLKEGDEIVYQPNSEYEFVIDDEVLYRMFTDNITIKLNGD